MSLWTFSLLGKEFLPELDEGDLWVRVQFPVGVSLEGVRPYVREIRERLLHYLANVDEPKRIGWVLK